MEEKKIIISELGSIGSEYLLLKTWVKRGCNSNVIVGTQKKFILGAPLIIGNPVMRLRITKNSVNDHKKEKHDPLTTRIKKITPANGTGIIIETDTSVYIMLPRAS